MITLLSKSLAGLSLTPAQRALLKLLESFALDGVIAALGAVAIVLTHDNPQVTGAVVFIVVGAFAKGSLLSASKYFSARGDAPLADALSSVAAGVSDYGNKPATPIPTPVDGQATA